MINDISKSRVVYDRERGKPTVMAECASEISKYLAHALEGGSESHRRHPISSLSLKRCLNILEAPIGALCSAVTDRVGVRVSLLATIRMFLDGYEQIVETGTYVLIIDFNVNISDEKNSRAGMFMSISLIDANCSLDEIRIPNVGQSEQYLDVGCADIDIFNLCVGPICNTIALASGATAAVRQNLDSLGANQEILGLMIKSDWSASAPLKSPDRQESAFGSACEALSVLNGLVTDMQARMQTLRERKSPKWVREIRSAHHVAVCNVSDACEVILLSATYRLETELDTLTLAFTNNADGSLDIAVTPKVGDEIQAQTSIEFRVWLLRSGTVCISSSNLA